MKSQFFAFGLLLALTSVMPAFAASSPQPMGTLMPSPMMHDTPQPHQVGDVSLALTVLTYRAVAYGERASKIIGSTVYNDQNQAIGKVADFVISPHDSVSIIIVSVGGFLGLGAKDVAISARQFQFIGKRVILPHATSQVLQQLPAFHFAHD